MAPSWEDVRDFAPLNTPRDGSVDWQPFIQAAIDNLLSAVIGSGGDNIKLRGTLYMPPGIYMIKEPILIMSVINERYANFCSLEITGDAAPFGEGFHSTVIRAVFNDKPALVVQGGRAVRIRKLAIVGKNMWYDDYAAKHNPMHHGPYQPFYDPSNTYITNKCRDNRYSPYAGICIDPFHESVKLENQYPEMESQYSLPGEGSIIPYRASSDVIIEECWVSGFVTGIIISPTGVLQNAENIRISNSTVFSNKSCLVVCQSQSRNVVLDNVSLSTCRFAINTVDYGERTGNCPAIFGANIGFAKEVFNVSSIGSTPSINALYCESILAIGQLGGGGSYDGYVFNSCTFAIVNTPEGVPAVNTHLANLTLTQFNGCTFVNGGGNVEPFRAFNIGLMTFIDCHFGGGNQDMAPAFIVTGKEDRVKYDNCYMAEHQSDTGDYSQSPLSNLRPVDHLSNYSHFQCIPGTIYFETRGSGGLHWVKGPIREVPLGQHKLKVKDGEATIDDISFPQILRVGDLIRSNHYFPEILNPMPGGGVGSQSAYLIVGKVKNATWELPECPSSMPSIQLTQVPEAVEDGMILNLFLTCYPRIHLLTRGTWDSNSKTITIVNGVAAASSWKTGQRIRGTGIPDGSFITNISGTTFTISANTTSSATNARLYDADIHEISTTPL